MFIGGDLPNKPMKSHTGYTQRGRAYAMEASRATVRHRVPVTGGVHGGEVGGSLKSGAIVAARVWWSGSPAGLWA